jgi:hypothetical protein
VGQGSGTAAVSVGVVGCLDAIGHEAGGRDGFSVGDVEDGEVIVRWTRGG